MSGGLIDKKQIVRAARAPLARITPSEALARIVSTYTMLPRVCGFWPFTSYNDSGQAIDISGQARHLTPSGALSVGMESLLSYFVLRNSGYLFRATEFGLEITGALSFGGWFKFDALAAVNFFDKFGAAGNYAYTIYNSPGNLFVAAVSGNGTALTQIATTGTTAINTWYFIAGKYNPSLELSLFVNGTKTTNTTSIPAAIYNSSAALQIGGNTALSQYMNGRAALCWLCAAAVDDFVIDNLYQITKPLFGITD